MGSAPGISAATEPSVQEGRFDLYLRGIKAGTLSFKGIETDRDYTTAGRMQSTGLIGAMTRASYNAQSQGRLRKNGGFRPRIYEEDANTGRRQMSASMAYRRGVPQVKQYTPARAPDPNDVDPSTQGGTLDPMTAIYAILKDQKADGLCETQFQMFDGRRVSRVDLNRPKREGDTVLCSGAYTRVAGFDAEDMAERTVFPVTVTYTPAGANTYRVTKVEIQTTYGRALMRRR